VKPVVGIVGGIGSGKSVVAELLRKQNGYLVSADQLGHEALRQTDIRASVVARWGKEILNEDGQADRKKIGKIVFAEPEELRFLESLVFPYIEKRIWQEIARAEGQPAVKFIILDAAIMMETGWHRFCYKTLFVDAPREIRLARLEASRGWSEKELNRREMAQMPNEEKKRRADVIILNDEGVEKVARQVQAALEQWNVFC
jgi:dephospho-CoA kinase